LEERGQAAHNKKGEKQEKEDPAQSQNNRKGELLTEGLLPIRNTDPDNREKNKRRKSGNKG